jgi:hypothetical protein
LRFRGKNPQERWFRLGREVRIVGPDQYRNMADPNAAVPPSYQNAPPPPPYPQGGYPPPQGYPAWQGAPPAPYRGPMLPPWLTFGSLLILVGGVLIMVGFIIDLVGTAAYAGSSATNAYQSYANSMEAYDALVGVGILIVVLGWLFHQMTIYRRPGR